jgi:hypothetical protein
MVVIVAIMVVLMSGMVVLRPGMKQPGGQAESSEAEQRPIDRAQHEGAELPAGNLAPQATQPENTAARTHHRPPRIDWIQQ